jgi:hypothetical protein
VADSKSKAKQIEELEAKHGRGCHLTTEGGKLLFFRALTLDEYEDYQDRLGKGKRGPILREMAQVTCVNASPEELSTEFQKTPALAGRVSDALAELAGGDLEVTVKKG